MTAPALATWTRALFAGDVLPPSATQLLHTPLFDFGDGTAEHPGWVGLQPDGPLGTPAYVVSGGGGSVGHDAIAAWLPDHDQVVVIATNGPDVIAENLFRTLVPALLAGDPPPHPAATTQTDPAALENLAGTYQLGPDDRFQVVPDQGLLRIEAHGPRALATLFPLDGLADPAEAAAHEARVAAFVAGDTEAGRQELDLLRQDFGDVQAARIVGTAYLDIELRTYVTFDFAGRPGVLAWYALDEAGTIAGADVNAEPPSLLLGATDTGTFVPAGAGASPEVEVAFDGDTMTVTSPDGATEARR